MANKTSFAILIFTVLYDTRIAEFLSLISQSCSCVMLTIRLILWSLRGLRSYAVRIPEPASWLSAFACNSSPVTLYGTLSASYKAPQPYISFWLAQPLSCNYLYIDGTSKYKYYHFNLNILPDMQDMLICLCMHNYNHMIPCFVSIPFWIAFMWHFLYCTFYGCGSFCSISLV